MKALYSYSKDDSLEQMLKLALVPGYTLVNITELSENGRKNAGLTKRDALFVAGVFETVKAGMYFGVGYSLYAGVNAIWEMF